MKDDDDSGKANDGPLDLDENEIKSLIFIFAQHGDMGHQRDTTGTCLSDIVYMSGKRNVKPKMHAIKVDELYRATM
jgi:hypothetical protein